MKRPPKFGDVFSALGDLHAKLKHEGATKQSSETSVTPFRRQLDATFKQRMEDSKGQIAKERRPSRKQTPRRKRDPVEAALILRKLRESQDIPATELRKIYGSPSNKFRPSGIADSPSGQAPVESHRENAWADLARLGIGWASAFSRDVSLDQPDPTQEGEQVVIGMDFGTAFTKSVVRFRERDHAANWDSAARIDDKYLMPTCFSEHESGALVLGAKTSPGWTVHRGIKMALLARNTESIDPVAVDTAVLFIALATRHVQRWFRENVAQAREAAVRWRLHLGMPSTAVESNLSKLFEEIGQRAYRIAVAPSPIRRSSAALRSFETAKEVTVLPELQAQLAAYHRSKQRQEDLHVLIDVGAGTLDCVFFVDTVQDDKDVIGVLGRRVENLGTHFLLAALVGVLGQNKNWDDADVSHEDDRIAHMTGDSPNNVACRRSDYKNKLTNAIYQTYLDSRKKYKTGPVNLKERPLRVFLCGGGVRIPWVRNHLQNGLQKEFERINRGWQFLVSDLPRPTSETLIYSGSQYDRMSVANGLCEMKRNLGAILWDADDEPPSRMSRNLKDRDEDR